MAIVVGIVEVAGIKVRTTCLDEIIVTEHVSEERGVQPDHDAEYPYAGVVVSVTVVLWSTFLE